MLFWLSSAVSNKLWYFVAVRILSKHLPAKPAGQLAYIVSLVLLPFWQHLASSPNWNLSLGTKNDPGCLWKLWKYGAFFCVTSVCSLPPQSAGVCSDAELCRGAMPLVWYISHGPSGLICKIWFQLFFMFKHQFKCLLAQICPLPHYSNIHSTTWRLILQQQFLTVSGHSGCLHRDRHLARWNHSAFTISQEKSKGSSKAMSHFTSRLLSYKQ